MALNNVFSDAAEENEIQQNFTSTAIMRYLVQLVRNTLLFLLSLLFFLIFFFCFMFIFSTREFYLFEFILFYDRFGKQFFFLIFLGLPIDDFFAKK